jgi:4'-phosphopantetheinyl transferase
VIQRRPSIIATVGRSFSPQEIAILRTLRLPARIDRFFEYWTLKEAYVKARGMGLSLPLNQFSILISSNHNIRITFAPSVSDDPQRWRFTLKSPSPRHKLAIADGSGLPGGLPIVVQPSPLHKGTSG